MKRWRLLITRVLFSGALAMSCMASNSYGQNGSKPVKVLFLLDGSSSMLDDWQPGTQRFKAASNLINAIVDSIQAVNPDVQFALRVFGHQSPVQDKNCLDTKLEVPYAIRNQEQIRARLRYISPRGVSPIAYALQKTAEENFINSHQNAYSIILLTDGGESCGGNMCDVINKLINSKIAFKPYILSLIDNLDLQKEYDCFGKLLTVAEPNQIDAAIKTIIDDNRLMYERNDGTFAVIKQDKEDKVIQPPSPKVTIPESKSEVPKENTKVNGLKSTKVGKLKPILTRKVRPQVVARKPLPPKSNIKFTSDDPAPVTEVVKLRPKVEIFKVKRTEVRWSTIRVLPGSKRIKAETKIRRGIKFTPDDLDQVVVVQNTPKPTPRPDPPKPKPTPPAQLHKQEEAPVKVVTVKSDDTKVMVYFTDGKGKYYKTEPKIDFVDVKTNKVVQSNFRLVDRSTGIPDPIKIPPGTYRIVKSGSNFKTAVVTIEENTTKRIDITIAKGSIKFRYAGNPNRPMIEYQATVQNSVEKGPLVRQRCDELLEYEPGIYHIEINTLPITVRTLPDLKFGELNVIDVKEPGTFFVSNAFRGTVQLWYERGDRYQPFYDFKLSGNPDDHKLELQPGKFKVFFFKDGKEQEKRFDIKSNNVTNVTL